MGEVYRADDLRLGQPVALKFLPDGLRQRPGAARAVSQRSAHGAAGVAPERLPRLRHRRSRRPAVPLDGVRRRRGPRDLAAPHRPLSRRQGRRHRAAAVRRTRRRARTRRAPSRSEAGQRHARRRRQGPDHGLRPRGTSDASRTSAPARRPTWRRSSSRARRSRRAATSSRWASCSTSCSPAAARSPRPRSASWSRQHADAAQLTPPSALVSALDPAIERAILRCLDPDPARRPASALAVAAALPGGDPLAAALAAGETPSPEMVAAAGEGAGLSRAIAWPLLRGHRSPAIAAHVGHGASHESARPDPARVLSAMCSRKRRATRSRQHRLRATPARRGVRVRVGRRRLIEHVRRPTSRRRAGTRSCRSGRRRCSSGTGRAREPLTAIDVSHRSADARASCVRTIRRRSTSGMIQVDARSSRVV